MHNLSSVFRKTLFRWHYPSGQRKHTGLGQVPVLWLLSMFLVGSFSPEQLRAAEPPKATLSQPDAIAFFIFNCVYYGQWPEAQEWHQQNAIRIGIWGGNSLRDSLERVSAQVKASWLPQGTVTLIHSTRPEDFTGCHLIYLHDVTTAEMSQCLEMFKKQPVALVSSAKHFLEQGGDFEIRFERERLGFDINLDGLERRKIELNSRMKKRAAAFWLAGKKVRNNFQEGKP